jgi:NADH-quinone oxidoreductase subunit C
MTEAPALPGDALREGVVTRLRASIGDGLLDSVVTPGIDVWVRVRNDAWRAAGAALRDELGCRYFCFLSAIDWLPSPYGRGEDDPTQPPPERDSTIRQGVTGGETRLQVFARVSNLEQHFGVTIKADVADDDPVIETWIPVYAGANWHEREVHEMYGIGFAGHPDLRNLYLPGEFEGYPGRRDFPLLARMIKPWPGIVDVEPLPDEDPAEGEPEASSEASSEAGSEAGS